MCGDYVAAVADATRSELRQAIICRDVKQGAAAINQNIIIRMLEQSMHILLAPNLADRCRAVEDVAQSKYDPGIGQLSSNKRQCRQELPIHSRRGVVDQEDVWLIAKHELNHQSLTVALHEPEALSTVPGL